VDSGIELEVALYGGVVMMLAYDRRTATRDVDAIFRPTEAARLPTAFRRGDLDDIVFLLRELRIASLPEVEAIVTDYYGRDSLGPEKR
jgi:hypothetical protein